MNTRGIHRVKSVLANGEVREYHYSHRGSKPAFWRSDLGIEEGGDEYLDRYRQALENEPSMARFLDGKRLDRKSPLASAAARIRILVATSRKRANARGLLHTITPEDVMRLAVNQGNKCALSGLDLDWTGGDGNSFRNPFGASLDRIDAEKGYLVSNVRLVLTIVNFGMSNWGEEVYKAVCSAVSERTMAEQNCKKSVKRGSGNTG